MQSLFSTNMNIFEIILVILVAGILLHLRKTSKTSILRETRLSRIKEASLYMQAGIVVLFPLGIYWLVAFFFGWHFFGQGKVRVGISPNHIYASAGDMPEAILVWWSLKMALGIFCYAVIFSLLRLYQKGILFSAKNIRRIYCLAYCLIADWFIDDRMQSSLQDEALSTTPVFVAFLIIFVAWVMGEARKIQEEQELTV
jgi:Protein of unknown function (DUF2975)